MTAEPTTIAAKGAALYGLIYRPEGAPKAALVIHPAVGVPQGFYRNFCAWAAGEGRLCLTYDYRGFGASGDPAASPATMVDWGLTDQSGALAHLKTLAPGAPIHVVGHSLGGYMTPFHESAGEIAAMTAVASGPAYWRRHPWPFRLSAMAFWWGPGPLLTALLGKAPGWLFGGDDIPKGVFWTWRRWCTAPDFYARDIGGALPDPQRPGFTGRLRTLAFTDDALIPPPVVAKLADYYPGAQIDARTIAPADHGLGKIGHVGAFSKRNAALWPLILPE